MMKKKPVKRAALVKNSGPKEEVKPRQFKIPKQLFAQLNECSHGGFILVTVSDKGSPEVHCRFDNSIMALGIQRFAADYFAAVTDAHRMITQSQLTINPDIDAEDYEDEEEFEEDDDDENAGSV